MRSRTVETMGRMDSFDAAFERARGRPRARGGARRSRVVLCRLASRRVETGGTEAGWETDDGTWAPRRSDADGWMTRWGPSRASGDARTRTRTRTTSRRARRSFGVVRSSIEGVDATRRRDDGKEDDGKGKGKMITVDKGDGGVSRATRERRTRGVDSESSVKKETRSED